MSRRVRLALFAALVAVAVYGGPGSQGASASAPVPGLPLDTPPSIMRQHLGFAASPPQASVPRAGQSPTRPSPHARLFRCKEAPGARCGIVKVPLDRRHPSRGTIPIFFEYIRHHGGGRARSAIVVTEGGPGYAVTQTEFEAPFYRHLFHPLLKRRDLILLDQRGVGRSQAIDCKRLQRTALESPDIYRAVRACGRQLGSASSVYGSGDVAHDLNAVRRALGIDQLDLYGGSYAGQDVQSYAARYPQHVRSAVLDSPLVMQTLDAPGYQFDDFGTDLARAVPRVASLLCARSRSCSAERANPRWDLRWLARRLRNRPLDGIGYDAEGKPHSVHVTEGYLAWKLLQPDDFGLTAPTEVGAAADALRSGDRKPLLRLAAEADASGGGYDPATHFSQGDNFARFCTDGRFPWSKRAPEQMRWRQWRRARNDLAPNRFGIFSVDNWLARPISPLGPDPCIAWPKPRGRVPRPIPRGGELPGRVPALVLTGDLDLSVPPPDSKPLKRLWPHTRYVEIANAQHHTLFSSMQCADPIIVNFIAKLRPGDTSCSRDTKRESFPSVGRFARTAADARPAAVDPGHGDQSTRLDRKVATVSAAAVTDAFRRAFLQPNPSTGPGLRSGTFTTSFDDAGASVDLSNARFAMDVGVSGTATYGFSSEVIDAPITVNGPGAEDGTLHIRGIWFGFFHPTTVFRVRGTLDSRHVAVQIPAS
jgi:pimeloyl-ACP methyl ester carboxylesterase